MKWVAARKESSISALAELAASAEAFRTALLKVAEEPRPTLDLRARRQAQTAARQFWQRANTLPRVPGKRRIRRLAGEWENTAAMTFWHHRTVYARAETLGFALLTQLPEQGAPSGPRWLEFRDAHQHATELLDRELKSSGDLASVMRAAKAFNTQRKDGNNTALAAAGAAAANDGGATDSTVTTQKSARRRHKPKDRGPIADQAELRSRISCDRVNLNVEEIFGDGGANSREASRLYRPWLDDILKRLDAPLPVNQLELIAEEWRKRRDPFRDDPEWADVVMVEPIPRQTVSRRWRRRHGSEPPPPLAADPPT